MTRYTIVTCACPSVVGEIRHFRVIETLIEINQEQSRKCEKGLPAATQTRRCLSYNPRRRTTYVTEGWCVIASSD